MYFSILAFMFILFLILIFSSFLLSTIVQYIQESKREDWATQSSIHLFAHTALSLTHSRTRRKVNDLMDNISCVFFIWTIVPFSVLIGDLFRDNLRIVKYVMAFGCRFPSY